MTMLADLALVATGGALGGMARHWLSGFIARRAGEAFPWGTLAVNVSGALLVGILMGAGGGVALTTDPRVWNLLVVGVLGSYTTVSSFSLQTLQLARGGEIARASANVAASFGTCLTAAATGLLAARAVVGG